MKLKLKGYSNGFEAVHKKELLGVIGALLLILTASKYLVHLIAWKVSGPISLIIGFLFLTIYLRRSQLTWKDLGFRRDKFSKLALWFVISVVCSAVVIILGDQLADLFFEKPPRANDRFGDLSGNIPLTLAWILAGIFIGGFGEELVYRGFLINAIERVIGKKYGIIVALIFPALFWAIRHYYYAHGHGSIMVFVMGIYLGLIYVLNGRNLVPGIVLHASFDTISFMARYEGG